MNLRIFILIFSSTFVLLSSCNNNKNEVSRIEQLPFYDTTQKYEGLTGNEIRHYFNNEILVVYNGYVDTVEKYLPLFSHAVIRNDTAKARNALEKIDSAFYKAAVFMEFSLAYPGYSLIEKSELGDWMETNLGRKRQYFDTYFSEDEDF